MQFQPDGSTTDMVFVVRRLKEIGWKAGVSLFMYSNDLQKAYGTVDRALLWQVLTRIGLPPQMVGVIRQLHDGMKARVQPGDDVCSDWFEVDQGLRQGCVLSPLFFNIFFAALLPAVFQKFSEDTVFLAELMYLKEPPTTMKLEPVTDYIRRVVFCDRHRGGTIFHLSRGRRDQNAGHIRWKSPGGPAHGGCASGGT